MKLMNERPYSDPEAAARKLMELAKGVEAVQDGRIHIEKINAPFLFTLKASGAEFGAGIKYAIEKGWMELHESGTYVRLLSPGDNLMSG
ncbi:hypothetical protein L6654_08125 [Bradyrhizobium sp. WYCCWR 13023]|uniref:Uncharacterized protein n=1 Tax=Bradyrhizobium zhengyangense TaxID=2911009 RepID=A0A9X1R9A0_9BRAD|nr:hypothetical protein [Bradyrhizobium zhengyangense]MCG2626589.1 hypothetical protein [Bradyrhizobium zhengyangense]